MLYNALLCVGKEVPRNPPALHAGPPRFFARTKKLSKKCFTISSLRGVSTTFSCYRTTQRKLRISISLKLLSRLRIDSCHALCQYSLISNALLCLGKEVPRNPPALHAGPPRFFARTKKLSKKCFAISSLRGVSTTFTCYRTTQSKLRISMRPYL